MQVTASGACRMVMADGLRETLRGVVQGRSYSTTRRPSTAGALVESPLQLLCTVEAHAAGLTGPSTKVYVRDDVPALADALGALREFRLPGGLDLDLVSRRSAFLAGDPVHVVGDAFSGLFQASLARGFTPQRRLDRLILVDDGLATIELARLLAAGRPLVRIGTRPSAHRRGLGALATRRLRVMAARGDLVLFSAMPLDAALISRLTEIGVMVQPHRFAWLSSLTPPDTPPEPTIVVGSAMVADGFVRAEPYVGWVRQVAQDGPVRYLPHRRQDPAVLAALAEIPQVVVDRPGAPAELRLCGLTAGQRVVSLPSTSAVLLSRILGSRAVAVEPHDVPEDWWTARATPELRAHLRSVLTLARAARDDAP